MDTISLWAHLGHLFALLLVATGPLPLCLLALARPVADDSAGHALLELWTAWLTVEIGVGLLLGTVGWFRPLGLAVAEGTLLATGVALALRRRADLIAALARIRPRRPQPPERAALLLMTLALLVMGSWKLLAVPTFHFDSLAYHLPVMARWVAAGRIEIFTELGQVGLYPSHWELLATLFVLPVGNDLFVSWPNLLAWLALGLAIALLASELGASRTAGVAAALLVLTARTILTGWEATQPDVAVAASFVSALYFGHRWLRTAEPRDLAGGILALCLLCGLKLSGPLYALYVFGGVLVWRLVLPQRGRGAAPEVAPAGERRRSLRPIAFGALLIVGAAGAVFWYLRNLLVLGNPFGRIAVSLGGWRPFGGELTGAELARTSLAALFEPDRLEHWRIVGRVVLDWLGLSLGALLVAAIGGGFVALRRRTGGGRERFVLVALIVATGLTYWFTPYSGDNGEHGWQLTGWIANGLRYGYPCLALLGVLGGWGATRLRVPRAALVAVPLLAVLLGIALEIRPGAAPLRFGVAAALVVSLLLVRSRLPVRAVALGVAVAALLGAGWASYRAQAERENAKRTRYGAVYTELMAYADPTETVGYVNLRRIYPAVGRAWRRRLVPCLPDSDDPARWVRRLREQGISLLLVGHTEAPAAEAAAVRHVQKWVRDEAGPFDLVHDFQSRKRHVAIFRLR